MLGKMVSLLAECKVWPLKGGLGLCESFIAGMDVNGLNGLCVEIVLDEY